MQNISEISRFSEKKTRNVYREVSSDINDYFETERDDCKKLVIFVAHNCMLSNNTNGCYETKKIVEIKR